MIHWFSIACTVAGFAGMQTRDARGNLSPEVWTQHSDHEKIGQLLDAESIKNMLVDQLRGQLDSQKDLLREVKPDVVIDFIIQYKQTWEDKYRENIQRNYDISQRILSAMQDTVYEMEDIISHGSLSLPLLRDRVVAAAGPDALPSEEAMVRFLFRNPYIGHLFQRAAGKTLHKREVCNKAGGYSAKQQRDDITRERDEALLALKATLEDPADHRLPQCLALVDSDALPAWLADHKKASPGPDLAGLLDNLSARVPALPDAATAHPLTRTPPPAP